MTPKKTRTPRCPRCAKPTKTLYVRGSENDKQGWTPTGSYYCQDCELIAGSQAHKEIIEEISKLDDGPRCLNIRGILHDRAVIIEPDWSIDLKHGIEVRSRLGRVTFMPRRSGLEFSLPIKEAEALATDILSGGSTFTNAQQVAKFEDDAKEARGHLYCATHERDEYKKKDPYGMIKRARDEKKKAKTVKKR
jgi:hypothetical protein